MVWKLILHADLVLREFFLRDLALTWLENYTTSRIYALIFGLTRFGVEDKWPHLSSAAG